MYQIANGRVEKQQLIRELPSFVLSLFLAEVLFKFGSFSLECVAFIVCWIGISWFQGQLNNKLNRTLDK